MGCQSSKTQTSAPTVAQATENKRQNDMQIACGSGAVQEQPVPPNSEQAAKPEHEDPVVLMKEEEAQDNLENGDQAVVLPEDEHAHASCARLGQTREAQETLAVTVPVNEKPPMLSEGQPTCPSLESASEEKEQIAATTPVNEEQEAAVMHVHEMAGGAAQDCLLSGEEYDHSVKLPCSGASADKEVKPVRAMGICHTEGDASACKLTSETAVESLPENWVQDSALPSSPQQSASTWMSVFGCCSAPTIV